MNNELFKRNLTSLSRLSLHMAYLAPTSSSSLSCKRYVLVSPGVSSVCITRKVHRLRRVHRLLELGLELLNYFIKEAIIWELLLDCKHL